MIRAIFQNPGATRSEMEGVHGKPVREDSAEADLFKLLIRELSMGGVIRQHRETTADAQFLRKQPVRAPKGYAWQVAAQTDSPSTERIDASWRRHFE
jgi:hypothetical protein